METLIELYDERPLENVLAPEVFAVKRVVYLCPAEAAQNKLWQQTVRSFLRSRGVEAEVLFPEAALLNADKLERQLRKLYESYPDMGIDITGGSDAALFACGRMAAGTGVPVITYSRKKQRFFEIQNAPFVRETPCALRYRLRDIFEMTGGTMETGRVDNAALSKYLSFIDPFFEVYRNFYKEWVSIVTYFQRCGGDSALETDAPFAVKGERGGSVPANLDAIRALESIGALKLLDTDGRTFVRFRFADEQMRFWLRDVGSVLELYVYKTLLDSGLFDEVATSVIVNWASDELVPRVSNEIDVMAMRGIEPFFLSCKTCAVSTEALNELAILKDRFGNAMARALLISSDKCSLQARQRATELGIYVVDRDHLFEDWSAGNLKQLLGV